MDILIAAVILTGLGVLAVLVLVLVGIHDEDRHMSLTGTPRTRTEAVTRRLLGVGVRTPGPCPGNDQDSSRERSAMTVCDPACHLPWHRNRPGPHRPPSGLRPGPDHVPAGRPGARSRQPARPAQVARGPFGPVAAQRRRRAVRPGRGRGGGELHRPVPDGRGRPPPAVVAALEAAIPDAAALVFACLGIALALHGRRALRARALNLASVGASVFMNAIAAAPGWRNLAIWAMPPVAYALASDTLIGVVRAWALARHQQQAAALAGEEATPLAVLGGLVLWLLRLALAPASTLAGFRAWVLEQCPVAPGRRAAPPSSSGPPGQGRETVPRKATKTARFLYLVTERHGPLAAIPLSRVAAISAALAPAAGLNTGAARAALRKAVLAARNGDPS